ncbi:MAG: 2-C-methyl-D-erythritol 2,4-cyclodiphosphate synthase [Phycisphaerae bacterium]|nr:2-C-methyl-D-erythritol 2,4-cyclodiphosphate synthase [Phycisphaerae bacterium]
MKSVRPARTGIGYDIHRLVAGRSLILGGVRIPYDLGLQGHSDADVVLHALCDALLGAAGQPDIGELFPDQDSAWAGADSRQFVAEALRRVQAAGLQVANVDLIIHAERPKLAPYKSRIKQAVAELLSISPDCVGLKATTNEGLDAIGRGEAIGCWASVLLTPSHLLHGH